MNATPRVVEAGLRDFQCAYENYVEDPFRLGQLVAVREGPAVTFGVVADIQSGAEDPSRPLQSQGEPGQTAAEVMAENPHIRPLLRTRLIVACCGHAEGETPRSALPPMPPPLLALVEPASVAETIRITSDGAFLALLVDSSVCDDAVIAAAIRNAAPAFAAGAYDFSVRAGKELARLLKAEPSRLTSILRGVAP